jgi:hypothetical protein
MLTLLETTAAIKALDTEPDIIKNACQVVLSLDKLGELSEQSLAKHLVFYYVPRIGSTKLMIALTLALGQIAALKVKPGREDELISGLMEQIRHELYSFQAFEKQVKSIFPAGLLEELGEALAKSMGKLPE